MGVFLSLNFWLFLIAIKPIRPYRIAIFMLQCYKIACETFDKMNFLGGLFSLRATCLWITFLSEFSIKLRETFKSLEFLKYI